MSNRQANVLQSEITRALKAAKAAGFDANRVEITPDGRIVLMKGKAGQGDDIGNEWDEVLGDGQAR